MRDGMSGLACVYKFNQPITIRRSGDIETAHIIHLEEGKKKVLTVVNLVISAHKIGPGHGNHA